MTKQLWRFESMNQGLKENPKPQRLYTSMSYTDYMVRNSLLPVVPTYFDDAKIPPVQKIHALQDAT